MNRTEYRQARRLCRPNGRSALRWLPADQAAVMERVMYETKVDPLQERANCYECIGWSMELAKSLAAENVLVARFAAKVKAHKAAMSQFQGVAA